MDQKCSMEDCELSAHTTRGRRFTLCREHLREAGRAKYQKNPRTLRTTPYVAKDGYVQIRRPDGKLDAEHRYVMEQVLGRPLVKGVESVHHKNGDRADNHPDNLELWVGGIRYGQRATEIVCSHCGTPYLL